MFRHWNAWDEGTRSHLFVVSLDGSGLRDLTPGAKYDVPPGPFGGSEGYALSPDGSEIDVHREGSGPRRRVVDGRQPLHRSDDGRHADVITAANKGADQNPVYSPDGRFIAYCVAGARRLRVRSLAADAVRAGDEDESRSCCPIVGSQRRRVLLRAGHERALREDDRCRPREALSLRPRARDGGRESGEAARRRRSSLVSTTMPDSRCPPTAERSPGCATRPSSPRRCSSATVEPNGTGDRAPAHARERRARRAARRQPGRGFLVQGRGWRQRAGIHRQAAAMASGRRSIRRSCSIHGGPQGAWLDQWHGRWNYQMFAAPGLALVIINPRGSTGYGQKFVDDVSKGLGRQGLHGSDERPRRRARAQ